MMLTSSTFLRRHRHFARTKPRPAHNPPRDIAFERCFHPFDRMLPSFYRTSFRAVPSLPKAGSSGDDDAIYVLRNPQEEILAAVRLTRSKDDGENFHSRIA